MLNIRNEGILLERTDLSFEDQAVLNPGCVEVDGIVHMFYRAVHTGNHSTIGYCQLKDNKVIYRRDTPLLFPEHDYEKQGLEDPRIVKHEDGTYYLFYTAFDGETARVAVATSIDLVNFTKRGLITPTITYEDAMRYFDNLPLKQSYLLHSLIVKQVHGSNAMLWEKDAFIFPKKINNKYALIHRILPSIQILYFDSLEQLQSEKFWFDYLQDFKKYTVLDPRTTDFYIGGGCPPIETPLGWLLIYHRVIGKNEKRIYCAGLALFDAKDPTKLIAKRKEPLFYPQEAWETSGDVNNVVFPTGAVLKEGRLYIYYGAADKHIGAKSMILDELLATLSDSSQSEIYPLKGLSSVV